MSENGFQEKAVRRCVRDDLMIARGTHELFTVYDWPMIEEVRAHSSQDRRVALLTRDVFDYITHLNEQGAAHSNAYLEASREEREKPTRLETVNYGADVSGLTLPFKPEQRQFMLYSESKNGRRLFTVNFRMRCAGPVVMTASGAKIGDVKMEHAELMMPDLFRRHLERLPGGRHHIVGENYFGEDLWERALASFDAIMQYSNHVC
jgi:hypothetical protein